MALRCSTHTRVYVYITAILFAVTLAVVVFHRTNHTAVITDLENVISQTIYTKVLASPVRQEQCRLHTNECFNIYRCGYNDGNKIQVYIYPFTNYFNTNGEQLSPALSREFYQLLSALKHSDYYTENIEEACIIIPAIDTLNQRRINIDNVARILTSLPSWKKHGGKNHIIFNMLPGNAPDFNTVLDVSTDKAILAGGGFSTWSYRPGFDISIPVFNSLTNHFKTMFDGSIAQKQKWFLLSTQVNYNTNIRESLETLATTHPDVIITNRCFKDDHTLTRCDGKAVYKYPQILQYASFCLVIRAARLGQSTLMDILMMQCIPVFVADDYVLPFSEVIDWKRASVVIREGQIPDIYPLLKSFTIDEISDMKKQVKHLWTSYFSSMAKIGLTTMRILNDRVFPNSAWCYERWNTPVLSAKEKDITRPPFIIPYMSAKKNGFTAVILSYDRLSMLFRVLAEVDKVPSLVKTIVVWNNVDKSPPQGAELPELSKPVRIIETKSNKLSNRFYPYNEIETEAVFSIDDDIVMLTTDEIQFGFEVWSEFPDRLVGFPARFHLSHNGTGQLKYESEWVNEVSMVLTGAAFHHKFYNHAFTYLMSKDIRDWVDTRMNCEDIAMNFLVANLTEKAPIKVTPRKRFRCPECSVNDALGSDPKHFQERTACIRKFAEIYGGVPLKSSEFRADPVIFKENMSRKVERFKDIGTI